MSDTCSNCGEPLPSEEANRCSQCGHPVLDSSPLVAESIGPPSNSKPMSRRELFFDFLGLDDFVDFFCSYTLIPRFALIPIGVALLAALLARIVYITVTRG